MAILISTTVPNLTTVMTGLINFCVANVGFTNQGTTTSGGITIRRMSKSIGGQTIHYSFWEPTFVDNNRHGFDCKMGTSLATTTSISTGEQAQFTPISTFGSAGPFEGYWIFSDSNNRSAKMVLEVSPGVYNHIMLGEINKAFNFDGGAFLTGGFYQSSTNQVVRIDLTNFTSTDIDVPLSGFSFAGRSFIRKGTNFLRMGGSTSRQGNDLAKGPTHGGFYTVRTNRATSRALLFPTWIMLRDPATSLFEYGGDVDGVRLIDLELINSESIVLSDWRVFPLVHKGGTGTVNYPATNNLGIAYEIVP